MKEPRRKPSKFHRIVRYKIKTGKLVRYRFKKWMSQSEVIHDLGKCNITTVKMDRTKDCFQRSCHGLG